MIIIYCDEGGNDGMNKRDEILIWIGGKWMEAGRMKVARHGHAMAVIKQEEVSAYCG